MFVGQVNQCRSQLGAKTFAQFAPRLVINGVIAGVPLRDLAAAAKVPMWMRKMRPKLLVPRLLSFQIAISCAAVLRTIFQPLLEPSCGSIGPQRGVCTC